jgi:hypothetical protein
MSHFAQIDSNDTVTRVLVIEQDVIDTELFGDPASFVQTSYNTRGGVHYDPYTNQPSEDQSKSLRKNFAGIGFKYDRTRDAFIPPQNFASWLLNEETCLWDAPVARPTDGKYYDWDEATLSWKEIPLPEA